MMKKIYAEPSILKLDISAEDIMKTSIEVQDEGDDDTVLSASWNG